MKKIYVIMALTSALSCMTACEKKMDETASQTVYTAAVDSYFTEAEENNGQTEASAETGTTVVSESEVPENTLENPVADTEKAIESVQTESDNPGELPVIFFEEPAVTTVVTVSADDTEENASSKAQEGKPETVSTKLSADDTDLPEIMVEEPVVIVTTVPSPSDDTEKPVSVQTTTTGKNGETPFIPAVTTPTAVATVTSVTETVTTKVTTTVTNPEEENIELPFVPAL